MESLELSQIKPHLMVHAKGSGSMGGAPGVHVGEVDRVEGDFIKVARSESDDLQHHWIPLDWVEKVDSKAVYINKTENQYIADRLDVDPLH